MISKQVIVRKLGRVAYLDSLAMMQDATRNRSDSAVDEFWVLEHDAVYTQGYSCDLQPVSASNIPVIATDRGGQITYHGPGQLIVYLLIDIRRRNQGVRNFVSAVESAIVSTLQYYGIAGQSKPGAPGVYVDEKKIASLGIRVSRGCTYHGLSLNVNLDIQPFTAIDVCGYENLEVTTLHALGVKCEMNTVETQCAEALACQLGYRQISYVDGMGAI